MDKKKIITILIIVGAVLALTLNKGFRNLITRKIEEYKLQGQLKQIIAENKGIEQKIYWLKYDKRYIEYRIRRDLGYIKKGEKEYRISGEPKGKIDNKKEVKH
ncbi:MAG: septum formation initiator family protein [Elusimicrobiota bacterium]